MTDAAAVFDDLRDEGDELDRLVADLPGEHWAAPTPAPGWSIAHQIAHLAWTDDRTLLAATDPEVFAEDLVRAAATITTYVDEGAAAGAVVPPADLLARWREGRAAVLAALLAVPAGQKLPWYGPPMSAPSTSPTRWGSGASRRPGCGTSRDSRPVPATSPTGCAPSSRPPSSSGSS